MALSKLEDIGSTVIGFFNEINPAADALNHLQSDAKCASEDLMVLSSVPFPEGVLEADRSKSLLPFITAGAAVIGIVLGLLLAGGSAALYVLRTGGKPIESGPPIGIIAYEVMMLVALSTAFLTALYEMRLPSWRAKIYDPRISEGMIGIVAHCGDDAGIAQARAVLQASGAVDVRVDSRSMD